mmetsp:Transcript_10955/g.31410  ORF Transcript_10955/g.31410 Transcript_10955/m.31410 type:complete len:301 (-) Transcript_10955:43-945(-)
MDGGAAASICLAAAAAAGELCICGWSRSALAMAASLSFCSMSVSVLATEAPAAAALPSSGVGLSPFLTRMGDVVSLDVPYSERRGGPAGEAAADAEGGVEGRWGGAPYGWSCRAAGREPTLLVAADGLEAGDGVIMALVGGSGRAADVGGCLGLGVAATRPGLSPLRLRLVSSADGDGDGLRPSLWDGPEAAAASESSASDPDRALALAAADEGDGGVDWPLVIAAMAEASPEGAAAADAGAEELSAAAETETVLGSAAASGLWGMLVPTRLLAFLLAFLLLLAANNENNENADAPCNAL